MAHSKRESCYESKPHHVLTPHAMVELRAKNTIHYPEQTDTSPEIIALHRLVHVEHSKRHEYRQGDAFLEDVSLRQIEHSVAQTMRRHLYRYSNSAMPQLAKATVYQALSWRLRK